MDSHIQKEYVKRPKYEENPDFTQNVINAMGVRAIPILFPLFIWVKLSRIE